MAQKTAKVIIKRKKFQEVEIPLIKSQIELIGNSPEELDNKTIKLDLTRQLRGKSIEAVVQIKIENNKPIAHPKKIRLMPYFIKRMMRKRISYIEDSFETPSQESMLIIKPFLITRKRVSRAVRRALRNRCKNWIEDYVAERKDNEIFSDIFFNKMQKTLSFALKKTYPLSLCEIRVLEIKRKLKPEEVPKIEKKQKIIKKEKEAEVIDQIAEIEQEKIKKAEKEIKEAQEKAKEIEKIQEKTEEKKEKKTEKKETVKKKTTAKIKETKTAKKKETKNKEKKEK